MLLRKRRIEMLKFNFIEFSEGTLETRINQQFYFLPFFSFVVFFFYYLFRYFAIDGPRTCHRPKQSVHFILYTKYISAVHCFEGEDETNIKWMNVFYMPTAKAIRPMSVSMWSFGANARQLSLLPKRSVFRIWVKCF